MLRERREERLYADMGLTRPGRARTAVRYGRGREAGLSLEGGLLGYFVECRYRKTPLDTAHVAERAVKGSPLKLR